MKGKITIVVLILFHVFFEYGIAQDNQTKFTLVKLPEGKPTGKITSITQDRYGYMWFGGQGESTLFRFDGSHWIRFGINAANQNSLKATTLEKVYADDSGMIWIGGNGLDQLNPSTGIFKHYRHEDKDPGSLSSNGVFAILKDHQGRLWVGTDNGLDRLDDKTGKFIHYKNEPGKLNSLSSNSIWTIYEDRQGDVWVGTGNPFTDDLEVGGLNRLDSGYTFTRYLHDPKNPQSLGNNKVRSIFEDSRGEFWIGTGRNGLYSMDRKTGRFDLCKFMADSNSSQSQATTKLEEWNIIHEQVTFICEDNLGQIWTGSMWSGIRRYDIEGKKFTLYKAGKDFPDSSGWTGYISRDGVLWIGTEESYLLYKGGPFRKKINSINTGSACRDFIEEKNKTLWVSTEKGELLQVDLRNLNSRFSHSVLNPETVFDKNIGALAAMGTDTIWLGTESGVGVFNSKTRQLSRFSLGLSGKTMEPPGIWDIFKDKNNNIWFATEEGAVVFHPKDSSITRFQHNEKDSGSIRGNRITSILEDRNGDFWIANAGMGCINRLIKGSGHFRHYLENYVCLFFYEDKDGTIWACTNRGLYRYNVATDLFSSFFEAQSPCNNDWMPSLVEDNDKNLWFTTQSSIGKIDPARKSYTVYGNNYGISHGSISPKSAYKTSTGQLLIGNSSGFFAFYPEELKDAPVMNILVTDFFVNDIPVIPLKSGVLQKPIEETNMIELHYDQKNIAFNFQAIDYSEQYSAIKYYTLLEGYDNTWREAATGKTAFSNLSPGQYIFRIRSFNSDGLKGEKNIFILVNPPWWKTWWAYSFYTLFAVLLLFAVYRTQKQRIIRREREKTQVIELEQAKEIEKAYHELRSTQVQLIQSEKMASLGELTAGIAHEIQNPLNFVNNFSEVNIELADELKMELNKSGLSQEEKNTLAGYIDDILRNQAKIRDHGQRAGSIVNSMLQHTRSSTGQKEPTDINALADEYLRLAYHGLKAKDKTFGVILKTDYDPSLDKISLIPQDIGRVLLNLYNNAFYAVMEKMKVAAEPYEPTVSVTTKKVNNKVNIIIKDNGTGIPRKIMDKIFQPFFTTKPTGQGTGLGLSLSYDIVKAHGGELYAESLPESKSAEVPSGTVFTIELPA